MMLIQSICIALRGVGRRKKVEIVMRDNAAILLFKIIPIQPILASLRAQLKSNKIRNIIKDGFALFDGGPSIHKQCHFVRSPFTGSYIIVIKSSLMSTMSAASLHTSVPALPMATPMSARFRATASFTPSPVMATISPLR